MSDYKEVGKLVIGGVSLLLSPWLAAHFRHLYEKVKEGHRRRQLLMLLRAEFGQLARHSATNLKRLTEIFRDPPTLSDLQIAVKKISLVGSHTSADETLFSAAKISDLALLPEHLSRDAMRIQLKTRNIEIDVTAAIGSIDAALAGATRPSKILHNDAAAADESEVVYEPGMSFVNSRLEALAQSVERCARDSSELIDRLKEYELSLIKGGRLRFWNPIWYIGLPVRWFRKKNTPLFTDRPIHFEDVTSLREVADWQSWKEEQTVLPSDSIVEIVRSCLDVGEDTKVEVLSQQLGTINQIARCVLRGSNTERELCVRIRVKDSIFQYEKGLVKEALIAEALRVCDPAQEPHDSLIAQVFQAVQEGKALTDSFPLKSPFGPRVHYFSPSYELGAGRHHALMIIDWAGGTLLGEKRDRKIDLQLFRALGVQVKRLQGVRFRRYYRNFRDLGSYRMGRSFATTVTKELEARNHDLKVISEKAFATSIERFRNALLLAEDGQFVLCHNDLHVNNVVFRGGDPEAEGAVSIIDWDNACVHHWLFDFVKIRYWGTLGADGRFKEDPEYFRAFCEGFGTTVEKVKGQPVFQALCALWLFRIYAFELKRESGGMRIPKPFLPAQHYRKLLTEIVRE